ncbi:tetratricopeptide repeat protein [Xanthomarina spongicola]|uniref:Tetratricopeptide repeat protein n=2 Tax=Xanthomarina spongicola TaxID=570520 RepID=A0A316DJR2_9FLAO|nr:tetratricopeptide repeat protein [Xanthomarina spongicola]
MQHFYILTIFIFFLSCKNDIHSDKEKIVTTKDGNTNVFYKNSFENGFIKDSIAAFDFDKGIEQGSQLNFKSSRAFFESANKQEPNNTIIINALGNVNADLKEFGKSYEYFEKSLRIDSLYAATYLNYGFSKARNDERKKAIELYKKGISLERSEEKRGYFHYNMSRAYYQLYDDENAKLHINKSIELVNDEVLKKEIIKFKEAINKN